MPNFRWILGQSPIFSSCLFREIANCQYCWFVLDVKASMLVVKNKSSSLLLEPNSIFMLILREKLNVLTPSMAALSRGCKPRLPRLWSHLKLCQTFGKSKFANFAKFVIFVKPTIIDMPPVLIFAKPINSCQICSFRKIAIC